MARKGIFLETGIGSDEVIGSKTLLTLALTALILICTPTIGNTATEKNSQEIYFVEFRLWVNWSMLKTFTGKKMKLILLVTVSLCWVQ